MNECSLNCTLCNRVKELTFHHLIPVTLHNNKWFIKKFGKVYMIMLGIMLCKDCHDYIHKIFKPKKLGRELNTESLLRDNEEMSKFISYIKKQK